MWTKSPLSDSRDRSLVENSVTNALEDFDSLNAAI
jgi:hypothetical protein